MDALAWHRFQFAFTVTYHYLFPQLTMGLALILVILKGLALRLNSKEYDDWPDSGLEYSPSILRWEWSRAFH